MDANLPIWTPLSVDISSSNLSSFQEFVTNKTGHKFENYKAFHYWSVNELSDFWECIALFFKINFSKPYNYILRRKKPFYKAEWFGNSMLSYTNHIERNFKTKENAILYRNEKEEDTCITWNSLFVKAIEIRNELLQRKINYVEFRQTNVEGLYAKTKRKKSSFG